MVDPSKVIVIFVLGGPGAGHSIFYWFSSLKLFQERAPSLKSSYTSLASVIYQVG